MLQSVDGVKIRDIIVNNSRLKTMELGRDRLSLDHARTALMSPAHEENNRGLEEVLSNGTVPQSNISRPTFTGYSK